MTGNTHLIVGAAISANLIAAGLCKFNVSGISLIGGVMYGSLLPDIDNPNSKIHKIFRTKSERRRITKLALSKEHHDHRKNITHWPLFWCVIFTFILLTIVPFSVRFFFIGLTVGVVAHLFCDMFTPYGIMLLAPFSRKQFRLAKISTGSAGEILFSFVAISVASVCLAALILLR